MDYGGLQPLIDLRKNRSRNKTVVQENKVVHFSGAMCIKLMFFKCKQITIAYSW